MYFLVTYLEKQRYERLNLKYLSTFFHQNVLILESSFNEVPPFEGSMSASHGDDLGLLDEQVSNPVSAVPQEFKRSKLLTM